jgi:hypothetical protein
MANELIGSFDPLAAVALHRGQPEAIAVGVLDGAAFPAHVDSTSYFRCRVPNAATLATGLTLSLLLEDDPLAPGPGFVAVFEVTYGPVVNGVTTPDEDPVTGLFVGTTPDTVAQTMPSAPGTTPFAVALITTAVAHTNGLVPGSWAIGRLRRKAGTDARDTHPGRVVVSGLDARNT